VSPPRIVIVGAGSGSFGPRMVLDACMTHEVRGATLALVDLDQAKLDVVGGVARRTSAAFGADLTIETATERRAVLPGADFVIVSFAIRRFQLWRQEFEIPLRHGLKQVLGENGGPGGLFHAMRNIPNVLAVCREVEELAPDALVLNFTNPLSRICLAMSKATKLRFVGMCHGIGMGVNNVARITGLPADEIVPHAAGINHFTWMLGLHDRAGADLYPGLHAASAEYGPEYMPLSRYLFDKIGLFPSPSDDHIGEYLPYAWRFTGLDGYDFDGVAARREDRWQTLVEIAAGRRPAETEARPSGELAFPIIASIVSGRPRALDAVNVPNRGFVPGLPEGAIVEVPGVADAAGVRGAAVEPLPAAVAGPIQSQLAVQELVVEAALTGSRRAALEALLADPTVDDARAAESALDELLLKDAEFLPQFR
jgi:alpha-galactosidase